CPGLPYQVNGSARDVHAQGGHSSLGQRDGQAAGAAAHIENWPVRAPEQFLVGGIGPPAPPGDLERQPAAVRGPPPPHRRLLVERFLVQGDRPGDHAVSRRRAWSARLSTVASFRVRAAKRLRGTWRATATASAAVSTSRSCGRSRTRSPAVTSLARWIA